jgi:hypothetical protein
MHQDAIRGQSQIPAKPVFDSYAFRLSQCHSQCHSGQHRQNFHHILLISNTASFLASLMSLHSA